MCLCGQALFPSLSDTKGAPPPSPVSFLSFRLSTLGGVLARTLIPMEGWAHINKHGTHTPTPSHQQSFRRHLPSCLFSERVAFLQENNLNFAPSSSSTPHSTVSLHFRPLIKRKGERPFSSFFLQQRLQNEGPFLPSGKQWRRREDRRERMQTMQFLFSCQFEKDLFSLALPFSSLPAKKGPNFVNLAGNRNISSLPGGERQKRKKENRATFLH